MTIDSNVMIIAFIALGGGAFVYALSYPYLSESARAQKRQAGMLKSSREIRGNGIDPGQRRKAIAETVKGMDARNQGKRLDLSTRISRAGLSWSVTQFWIGAIVFALVTTGVSYWFNNDWMLSLGIAVVSLFGIPLWLLSFLGTRRVNKFVEAFPGAIDVIIRGVRAGLPVGDCFRLIATESPEPVRSEFERIVEAQAVGLAIGEAVERLSERMPIPETSFFAIVLNVQQKTGGNLSEALGNLASVLRDRKKMKDKVQAISAEAKASAGIIGALPFIVSVLVYFVNPDYIMMLFNTTTGNIIIAGTLIWMSIGIFIMRAMINFDF